jgi:glyoxylase-like metal-dependent hydrolase (beta-lactamase superfamily II)
MRHPSDDSLTNQMPRRFLTDPIRVQLWGFVNAYLVREEDGFTLIDTTMPRGARKILAVAREAGLPIKRIALTHGHGDHIGGLDALVRELPGVEAIVSARDARLLEKDLSLDPDEPQTAIRGDLRGCVTRPTRTVVDGDRIGSLQVVASPGHTPGHVAFLDARDGTLYCGDAFSTRGGVETSARANPRFPFVVMGTWHRPTVLVSARKLRSLEPARLAPGHGRVLEAPTSAMDAAIQRAADTVEAA